MMVTNPDGFVITVSFSGNIHFLGIFILWLLAFRKLSLDLVQFILYKNTGSFILCKTQKN